MASLFVAAAQAIFARYRPQCAGFTFDPGRPFGLIEGDFSEPLLNLGAEGAMLIMGIAERFTARDVEAVLHFSYDRDEFFRWFQSLEHTFNRTQPETAELRALKAHDEKANSAFYRIMGLPVG